MRNTTGYQTSKSHNVENCTLLDYSPEECSSAIIILPLIKETEMCEPAGKVCLLHFEITFSSWCHR